MTGYIFGGNTGLEYEDLQRKRKLAEQLRNRVAGNAPRNVGEGINAIGQALLARAMEKKAEKGLSGLADRVSQSPEGVDPSIVRALLGRSPDAVAGGAGGTVGGAGQDLLQPSPRAIPQMQGAGNLPQDPAPMPYREGFGDTAIDAQDVWPGGPNAGMEDLEGWQIDRIKKDNMRQLAPQLDQYDPASRQRLLNDPQAQQPAPIDERELIGGDGMELMDGGEGNDLPYGSEKLTGDQSKAIAYFRRALGANNALSDPKLAGALTEFDDAFAGNFGGLGRLYQSEDYQVANRAAQEFLAAILRKDTGAAITREEFQLYGPMYLPQPGDKPAMLEAKRKARAEALTAIEMGLGTAAPLAEMARDELQPAAPDLGSMSDEDLMKMLTGGN